MHNLATDHATGHMFDCTGATSHRTRLHVSITSRDGALGHYVGGTDMMLPQVLRAAQFLIGMGWHEREWFYEIARRQLQKNDRMGVGLLDSALWDMAGKRAGMSVSELLGGSRSRLPAYASTWMGGPGGQLETAEHYVAFAEECHSLGYRAFKMHGWGEDDVAREIEAVRLLGKTVGHKMRLMTDPMCCIRTFADTLALGRACDEAGFFWMGDPMSDGGQSSTTCKSLREKIRTPIMVGECVRGIEANASLVLAGASDFVRVDPDIDMGVTGTMKLAHFAEAIGLDVELHAPGPAQRACLSAIRNSNLYELSMVAPGRALFAGGYFACDHSDALDDVGPDGCFPVPIGPGMGVKYDHAFIERLQVARHEVTA